MMILVLMLAIYMFPTSAIEIETYNLINSTNLAKLGCDSRCGDLIVPYPFGIIGSNSNCSIDSGFDIYCNRSVNPPRASFTARNPTSIKNISDSTLRRSILVARTCSFPDGNRSSNRVSSNYNGMPYTFSEVNKFTVIGCDSYAWLNSATSNETSSTGCMVFCSKPEQAKGGQCSGNGCCCWIMYGFGYVTLPTEL